MTEFTLKPGWYTFSDTLLTPKNLGEDKKTDGNTEVVIHFLTTTGWAVWRERDFAVTDEHYTATKPTLPTTGYYTYNVEIKSNNHVFTKEQKLTRKRKRLLSLFSQTVFI